jgi:restriction endonuclease S subunit
MVTLAEERKQHNEYQFDAAAVIVPLISSTGHGHASIKRIHYQEGKFALGTILCAVIPKDERVLNPRYLFVYLQQFKDSVLVPLMKGAANVSLPLNKLAALEIEVPTLAKQQEVIDLAAVLTGHKNELETRLDAQEVDTAKLRQALLREAMQGQLLPQDPTDEPAVVLLQQLQAAKATAAKGGRGKAGSLFAQEAEAVEGPFEIPNSWVWCKLGDICRIINGRAYKANELLESGTPVLRVGNLFTNNHWYYSNLTLDEDKYCDNGDLIYAWSASFGPRIWEGGKVIYHYHIWKMDHPTGIDRKFLYHLLFNETERIKDASRGGFMLHMTKENMENKVIPLPPLAEQNRIVAKLEQLLGHCDALEQRTRESRRLAEQLLATALREALAPPTGTGLPGMAELELAETAETSAPRAPRRGAQLALGSLLD